MTRSPNMLPMARLMAVFALLAATVAAQDIPAEIAARHPEGKWELRKSDLYRYLVRFHGASPDAIAVFDDYLKLRFVHQEARRRKISVTDKQLDGWMANLERRVKEETGGRMTLDQVMQKEGMTRAEMRRRARTAIMREQIARKEYLKRDPTRDPKREVTEADVQLVVEKLYDGARKELDAKKLPKGVIARIDGQDVTVYDYGRELSYGLPHRTVLDSFSQLIAVESVRLLLGDRQPTEEELRIQKRRFYEFYKNLLKQQLQRRGDNQTEVTPALVRQFLTSRGRSPTVIFEGEPFRTEAMARAHFRGQLDEKALRAHYEANKGKFGDKYKLARIFVAARAQRQVNIGGKRTRTLAQGRARSDALWMRVTRGEKFAEIARKESDDSKLIRDRGGDLGIWVHGDVPGYKQTVPHLAKLEVGGISKPFYTRRGGYSIVKLLDRKRAPPFEKQRDRVREDAGDRRFEIWRAEERKKAIKSTTILEQQ